MDCIDLNIVERSIREKNYECDMLMRWPIAPSADPSIIASSPVEYLLHQDLEFRSELEGSIRSYFKIFINTSQHTRLFKKYEGQIKAIGINLPESIRMKIKAYFQQDLDPNTDAGTTDAESDSKSE
jgi:hypothetical protein